MSNDDSPAGKYASLRQSMPQLFDNPPGDVIRVITDSDEIEAFERAERASLAQYAKPLAWAEVGVVYEDAYIRVVRDAVAFPDGKKGSYIRVVPGRQNFPGASVLPLEDDRIVLLRHFRHATRRWHLEIPRGFANAGEAAEDTAKREVYEEIGARVQSLTPLGGIHTNTGLLSEYVPLFAARIDGIGQAQTSEGIANATAFTADEIDELLRSNEITDAFTICAITKARIRGVI
ncbi:MAG: NUDIX hydrolase [Planctomycetaceae bacterium]|nr:NUDIX hydrolase [Planctomycetaceae bacterium]